MAKPIISCTSEVRSTLIAIFDLLSGITAFTFEIQGLTLRRITCGEKTLFTMIKKDMQQSTKKIFSQSPRLPGCHHVQNTFTNVNQCRFTSRLAHLRFLWGGRGGGGGGRGLKILFLAYFYMITWGSIPVWKMQSAYVKCINVFRPGILHLSCHWIICLRHVKKWNHKLNKWNMGISIYTVCIVAGGQGL